MTAPITDADVVDGTSTELVAHDTPAATNLFRTDDPVEVVEKAARVADALKGILDRQGLTKQISGRQHVLVEGWTTLGSMLGVVPVCVWTRKLDNGFEARVEARTMDGRVIGAAEAECTRDERMWKSRDDYALRSMAQTRATSKALRGPLGFIVTLAGYEGTPVEEMPADNAGGGVERTGTSDVTPTTLTTEQYQGIVAAFAAAKHPEAALNAFLDDLKVPPADDTAHRIGSLDSFTALKVQQFLDRLRPQDSEGEGA